MARNRLICTSCDAKIPVKSFCPKCGNPTPHASAQERIVWEMGQWETSRPASPEARPAQPLVRPSRETIPAPVPERLAGPSLNPRPIAPPADLRPVAPPADPRPIAPQPAVAARHSPAPPAGTVPFAARATTTRPQGPSVPLSRDGGATRVRPPAPHAAQRIVVQPSNGGGKVPVAPLPNVVALAAALREASRDSEETVAAPPPARAPERNGNGRTVAAASVMPAPARSDDEPLAVVPDVEVAEVPLTVVPDPVEVPEESVPAAGHDDVEREPEPAHPRTAEPERKRARESRKDRRAAAKAQRAVKPERVAKPERAPKTGRRAKTERAPKPKRGSKAERAPKERLSRKERRLHRQTVALDMREGETLTRSLDGRSRFRRATLLLTNYRVAVVSRSRKRRIVRWIPLEEVSQIDTAWRGAPTVMIEASIESLSFNNRSGAMLAEMVEVLEKEVREAHSSGARRHHPEITQEWCDRTGEVWDSNAGRLRLWIRRHPVFTLTWLASIVPIAYFAAPR